MERIITLLSYRWIYLCVPFYICMYILRHINSRSCSSTWVSWCVQNLLHRQRKSVQDRKERYDNGLLKLADTEEQVAQMQIDLEELQPKLKEATIATDALLVQIAKDTEVANEKKAVVEKEASSHRKALCPTNWRCPLPAQAQALCNLCPLMLFEPPGSHLQRSSRRVEDPQSFMRSGPRGSSSRARVGGICPQELVQGRHRGGECRSFSILCCGRIRVCTEPSCP